MDTPETGKQTEFICPACGSVLTDGQRTNDGWNCRCGEFIPETLGIDPRKGVSNQHRQNKIWR